MPDGQGYLLNSEHDSKSQRSIQSFGSAGSPQPQSVASSNNSKVINNINKRTVIRKVSDQRLVLSTLKKD